MKRLTVIFVFLCFITIALSSCVKYCSCVMPNTTSPTLIEADITEECSDLSGDDYGDCM